MDIMGLGEPMNSTTTNTHIFPKAEEVFLPRAPLVAVLAQVRFESVLSIQNQSTLAPFQDAIREQYPIFKMERAQTTTLNSANKTIRLDRHIVWKFTDIEDKWRVALSHNFITMETRAYTSREDFMAKFDYLVSALHKHFKPGVVTRTGMRYIDRLTGDALADIKNLVKPELVGVLSSDVENIISATNSEAFFDLSPFQLMARWGTLPPNSTTDPTLITPEGYRSWILDIDASRVGRRPWVQKDLTDEFKNLAEHCYDFFRWAVRKEFLKHFGGKV